MSAMNFRHVLECGGLSPLSVCRSTQRSHRLIRIAFTLTIAFSIVTHSTDYDFDGKMSERNQWGQGASVPDVGRDETKLWFYFLARSYLDAGSADTQRPR